MEMPELKCFSIICHIPGLGLRKGSSTLPSNPQAIKTCMQTLQVNYFSMLMIIFMFFTLNALLSVSDPYTISDDKRLLVMQGLW